MNHPFLGVRGISRIVVVNYGIFDGNLLARAFARACVRRHACARYRRTMCPVGSVEKFSTIRARVYIRARMTVCEVFLKIAWYNFRDCRGDRPRRLKTTFLEGVQWEA
jgi:hypothetical protein